MASFDDFETFLDNQTLRFDRFSCMQVKPQSQTVINYFKLSKELTFGHTKTKCVSP